MKKERNKKNFKIKEDNSRKFRVASLLLAGMLMVSPGGCIRSKKPSAVSAKKAAVSKEDDSFFDRLKPHPIEKKSKRLYRYENPGALLKSYPEDCDGKKVTVTKRRTEPPKLLRELPE